MEQKNKKNQISIIFMRQTYLQFHGYYKKRSGYLSIFTKTNFVIFTVSILILSWTESSVLHNFSKDTNLIFMKNANKNCIIRTSETDLSVLRKKNLVYLIYFINKSINFFGVIGSVWASNASWSLILAAIMQGWPISFNFFK